MTDFDDIRDRLEDVEATLTAAPGPVVVVSEASGYPSVASSSANTPTRRVSPTRWSSGFPKRCRSTDGHPMTRWRQSPHSTPDDIGAESSGGKRVTPPTDSSDKGIGATVDGGCDHGALDREPTPPGPCRPSRG